MTLLLSMVCNMPNPSTPFFRIGFWPLAMSLFSTKTMLLHPKAFVLSFSPLLFAFFGHCSAAQFMVGDSSGWNIPPYPTFYANWSHSHFFRAGDSLEFDFDTKFYNLVQVSQYDYEHCTSKDAVKVFNSSPAIVPLNESGVLYFLCNISNYCCLGQKIAISVHECSAETPSPSSSAPVPFSPSPRQPPNGSSPPNGTGGSIYPPVPAISPAASAPDGNGGYSPEPSTTTKGHKSSAMTLEHAASFAISLGSILSTFAGVLGFWMM